MGIVLLTMVNRMRSTRGKTGSRRAHHGLTAPRLSRDTKTESTHLRHHVDLATGMYRGKQVFEPKAPKETVEETGPTPEEQSTAPEEALTPVEEITPKHSGKKVSKEAADSEPQPTVPEDATAVQTPPRQSKKESP